MSVFAPNGLFISPAKDGGFTVMDCTLNRTPYGDSPTIVFAGELRPCLDYLERRFTPDPPGEDDHVKAA